MFWKVAEDSLEDILGHFHIVHDKLSVFIDRVNDVMGGKQQQVNDLLTEIQAHNKELAQAATVKDNIKKLLGQ